MRKSRLLLNDRYYTTPVVTWMATFKYWGRILPFICSSILESSVKFTELSGILLQMSDSSKVSTSLIRARKQVLTFLDSSHRWAASFAKFPVYQGGVFYVWSPFIKNEGFLRKRPGTGGGEMGEKKFLKKFCRWRLLQIIVCLFACFCLFVCLFVCLFRLHTGVTSEI